jgi:hypothetical protein
MQKTPTYTDSGEDIETGDLVRLIGTELLGVVLKLSPFDTNDSVLTDIQVYWSDNKFYWCLKESLILVSKMKELQ